MDNHAKNVCVSGCLKFDYLLDKSYVPREVWRPVGLKKRVIWAPHHSFENQKPYAKLCAFFDLYDFMLELAEEYRDTIQFAFKPHPMLKPRLYHLWGKRRTDEYYRKWADGANTQFEDGEYFDLFLTSDAMILDSVSFIPEYSATGKPAFFTYGKDTRFPELFWIMWCCKTRMRKRRNEIVLSSGLCCRRTEDPRRNTFMRICAASF